MSTSSVFASDLDSDNHEEWIGVGRVLPENPNLIPTGLAKLFAMYLEA